MNYNIIFHNFTIQHLLLITLYKIYLDKNCHWRKTKFIIIYILFLLDHPNSQVPDNVQIPISESTDVLNVDPINPLITDNTGLNYLDAGNG